MPRKKPASKTVQQKPRVDIQRWIMDRIAIDRHVIHEPYTIADILKCSVSGARNAFKTLEGAGIIQQSDTDSRVYVQGPGMKPSQLPIEAPGVDQLGSTGSDRCEALRVELINAYERILTLENTCTDLREKLWQAAKDASNAAMSDTEDRIEELKGE